MAFEPRPKLTERQHHLLEHVARTYAPELTADLTTDAQKLPWEKRDALKNALIDAFVAEGLRPDREPDPLGIEYEDIIDALGYEDD